MNPALIFLKEDPLFLSMTIREIRAKIASKKIFGARIPSNGAFEVFAHFTIIVRQKEISNGDSLVRRHHPATRKVEQG